MGIMENLMGAPKPLYTSQTLHLALLRSLLISQTTFAYIGQLSRPPPFWAYYP